MFTFVLVFLRTYLFPFVSRLLIRILRVIVDAQKSLTRRAKQQGRKVSSLASGVIMQKLSKVLADVPSTIAASYPTVSPLRAPSQSDIDETLKNVLQAVEAVFQDPDITKTVEQVLSTADLKAVFEDSAELMNALLQLSIISQSTVDPNQRVISHNAGRCVIENLDETATEGSTRGNKKKPEEEKEKASMWSLTKSYSIHLALKLTVGVTERVLSLAQRGIVKTLLVLEKETSKQCSSSKRSH